MEQIRRLVAGSAYDAVMLREKDLTEREYREMAERTTAMCRTFGKPCILHGFPGVALALGHPFLHLPLSVWEQIEEKERRVLREKTEKIGTSVHSEKQLDLAVRLGADYVFYGHVFETDCKPGVPPRGLMALREICLASPVPVFAIGGMREDREASALSCGAAGVCYMSASMKSGNLEMEDEYADKNKGFFACTEDIGE